MAVVLMLWNNKERRFQKETWVWVMIHEHSCLRTETYMGFLWKFLAASLQLFNNSLTEKFLIKHVKHSVSKRHRTQQDHRQPDVRLISHLCSPVCLSFHFLIWDKGITTVPSLQGCLRLSVKQFTWYLL